MLCLSIFMFAAFLFFSCSHLQCSFLIHQLLIVRVPCSSCQVFPFAYSVSSFCFNILGSVLCCPRFFPHAVCLAHASWCFFFSHYHLVSRLFLLPSPYCRYWFHLVQQVFYRNLVLLLFFFSTTIFRFVSLVPLNTHWFAVYEVQKVQK